MKQEINLTRSEINTLIAGMLICSVRYDSVKNKQEAARYKQMENKLRDLFYYGEEVSEGKLTAISFKN